MMAGVVPSGHHKRRIHLTFVASRESLIHKTPRLWRRGAGGNRARSSPLAIPFASRVVRSIRRTNRTTI